MKRHEIERKVDEIIDEIADKFKIDVNFYGDCIPFDIQDFERKLEFCKNEDDEEYYFEKIKEYFESSAEQEGYRVHRIEARTEEIKETFLDEDEDAVFEAIKKVVPTGVRFQVEEMNRKYDNWEVGTYTSIEEAYNCFLRNSNEDYTYLNYIAEDGNLEMIIKRYNSKELCFEEQGIE